MKKAGVGGWGEALFLSAASKGSGLVCLDYLVPEGGN